MLDAPFKLGTKLLLGTLGWASERDRWQKRLLVFLMDFGLLVLSIWLAYAIRLGEWVYWNTGVENILLGSVIVFPMIFHALGVYQVIFRYVGVGMMRSIVRAFIPYTLIIITAFSIYGFTGVPRTLGLLQPIMFFLLIAGSRLGIRYLIIDLLTRSRFAGDIKRVVIYGAGTAGQQLINSLRFEAGIVIVGYIDDDRRLIGQRLDGLRVYESSQLPQLVERLQITNVLLALPTIGRARRAEIIEGLSHLKVDVKTLPKMSEMVGGEVSYNDLRAVRVEDLLGREPVAPNQILLAKTLLNKVVLVTGAGGSIGSELCRQIIRARASTIILLDSSEFNLYSIEKELKAMRTRHEISLTIVPVLGSVIDQQRLKEIFSIHSIDTVFHAAAYKHVPLVEENPIEGLRNNVVGTYTLANEARLAGVSDFILISTDKAVRPTNFMGASKRCAEQIVQSYARQFPNTRFSMVRFGNVLGSSGSVVPLFHRQILVGGPVTITHRDVTRYFMTIPEAASLVIQAAGLAQGGDVFVLDMGQPVRIVDLARTMIKLSGLAVRDQANPDGDIEIVEIGLRDGEKLYEELLISDGGQATNHAKIRRALEPYAEWESIAELIHALSNRAPLSSIVSMLQRVVPEFSHLRDNDVRAKSR